MKLFQGKNNVPDKVETSNAVSKIKAALWAAFITLIIFLIRYNK